MKRQSEKARKKAALQQALEEGKQAALRGEDCNIPYPWYALEKRNAWLIGWRNGGGNIFTKKVDSKEVSK
jgi:ribosome modulation factor